MRTSALLLSIFAFNAAAPADAPPAGKTAGVAIAPIMIEVFSDFQCPSCREFHQQTLQSLIADYVNHGKVYLVYRDFPLAMHAFAKEAAAYADAAVRVGKYQAVCDALFASQPSWSNTGKVEDAACSVLTPAEAKKVRLLAKDPAVAGEIQRDVQLGRSAGIDRTPTLLITRGQKRYPVSGSLRYSLLRRVLDDLLALQETNA